MGLRRCWTASITACQAGLPCRRRVLDLHDQDDRVANDHAGQRNDAQDGHEPHGRAGLASRAATTPIRPSGACTLTTRNSRWKLSSWIISTVSMSMTISEHDGQDGDVALRALLHGAAVLDGSARRQGGAQPIDLVLHALVDRWRLDTTGDIGLHGNGR